jgi:hypothetical protein
MARHKTVNEYIIKPPIAWLLCVHMDQSVTAVTIDACDVSLARIHKWSVGFNQSGYCFTQTSAWEPGIGQRTIRLVRYLLNAPPDLQVDHIDRNPLNCRRKNLRLVTFAENRQNLSPEGMGSLHIRGVSIVHGKYLARIILNGQVHRLGFFHDRDAAKDAAIRFRSVHMPFSPDAIQFRGAI